MPKTKSSPGPFFEDFTPSQRISCPAPRAVTSGEVTGYHTLIGDRTPRYVGAERVVHPLLLLSIVTGHTVRHLTANSVREPTLSDVLFKRPVKVGGMVYTDAKVIGLEEAANREHGTVWARVTARDRQGEVLLSFTQAVPVKKRSLGATRWLHEPMTPTLRQLRDPNELAHDKVDKLPRPGDTGSNNWFTAYESGERVLHFDGYTINKTDHMQFARMVGNGARRHFDVTYMRGKPEVSGMFCFATGYAQALNGFENRIGIMAINHAGFPNTAFARDTLHAFTNVLDTHQLDERVGAIRCRLFVVKNEDPATNASLKVLEGGRYSEIVVADIDYWDVVPLKPRRR